MTQPEQVHQRTQLVTVSLDSAVVNHPAAQSAGVRAVVAFLAEAAGIDKETLLAAAPYGGRLSTPEDLHAILEHPALSDPLRALRQRLPGLVTEGYAVFRRERQRILACYRGVPEALSAIRKRVVTAAPPAGGGGLLFLSSLPPPVLRRQLASLGLNGVADVAYSLCLEDPRTGRRADRRPLGRDTGATPIRGIATATPGLTAALLRDVCGEHGTAFAESVLVTGRLVPDLSASWAAGTRAVLCRFDRPSAPSKVQDIGLARDWAFEAARQHTGRRGDLPEPYAVVRSAAELGALPCFSGAGPRHPAPLRQPVVHRHHGVPTGLPSRS